MPAVPAVQAADKLKKQLAEELAVPLLPPLPHKQQQQQLERGPSAAAAGQQPDAQAASSDAVATSAGAVEPDPLDLHPFNVRRAAMALQRHGHQMPEARRRWASRLRQAGC